MPDTFWSYHVNTQCPNSARELTGAHRRQAIRKRAGARVGDIVALEDDGANVGQRVQPHRHRARTIVPEGVVCEVQHGQLPHGLRAQQPHHRLASHQVVVREIELLHEFEALIYSEFL